MRQGYKGALVILSIAHRHMSQHYRYRALYDALSYDLFVRLYDPLRSKLLGNDRGRDHSRLFVHIPKCAGTSLFSAMRAPNRGHRLFCDIPNGEKSAAASIVFCTRDPVDRVFSAFGYVKQLERTKSGLRKPQALRGLDSFEDFVMSDRLQQLAAHHFFFRSQFRYLSGVEQWANKLLHIRFENLVEDADSKLGLKVPRLNPTEYSAPPASFGSSITSRLKSVYRDDYEALPALLRDCGIEITWKA